MPNPYSKVNKVTVTFPIEETVTIQIEYTDYPIQTIHANPWRYPEPGYGSMEQIISTIRNAIESGRIVKGAK